MTGKNRQKDTAVLKAAREVLENNRVKLDDGGFTKPAEHVYPFQWNWDAGFIAIGYSHFDLEKAVTELKTLFKGQWKNGFLPHIIFHKESLGYFPAASFWQAKEVNTNAPEDLDTSGITQPPVHAIATWDVYKKLKEKDRKGKTKEAVVFLEEMYPKLFLLHQYFYTHRDPEGSGMITIYHPWESGLDNSPRWDETLAHIVSHSIPEYKRVDTSFIDKKYRPTDEAYDHYMSLAQKLKEDNYDDVKISTDHPFRVKDILMSSLLYRATKDLKLIAKELQKETEEIDQWLGRFEEFLFEKCWNAEDNLFYDYDLVSDCQIKAKTVATIFPLITGLLTKTQIRKLFTALDQKRYCGTESCTETLLPSTGLNETYFNADLYWRGPIWINVNWLIFKGLRENDLEDEAQVLKEKLIALVKEEGMWEYYSPLTHEGRGAETFSWTAALLIDLFE